MTLRFEARADVRPTEDPAKVRAALERLFPGATLEELPGEVRASVPDLKRVRELIRSQRIPDTARGVMLAGLSHDGSATRFFLGKQAAAAGKAHFGALGGPLGEILVIMEGAPGEAERHIYHLAPDTTVDEDLAEVPHSMRPPPS